MRIIAFVNKDSGPSYHRIIVPLVTMPNVDIYLTNNLREEHFEKGCDIFMYNRVLPESSIPIIERLKKKYGFRICVDLDDFWELDPHHILYQEYQDTQFAKRQIEHIKKADVVLVTHDRLATAVKEYNENVHIAPNAIHKGGQFDIERQPSDLTRLFWQGSITHHPDIEILAPALERIGPISHKIKMLMGGYHADSDVWNYMARLYTANLKHQYKLLPGLPVTDYYRHYEHADVCLVPLVNSIFNRMKSNLKILEAANLALPVIASKVHPYMDMPVMYASKPDDWCRHIIRLVSSKKRQMEAGAELKEYCDRHFDFQKINLERKQILEFQMSKTI